MKRATTAVLGFSAIALFWALLIVTAFAGGRL